VGDDGVNERNHRTGKWFEIISSCILLRANSDVTCSSSIRREREVEVLSFNRSAGAICKVLIATRSQG